MRTAIAHLAFALLTAWSLTVLTVVHTASAGFYSEDFTTADYCDTVNTTAWWDQSQGQIGLYPYEPAIVATFLTDDETDEVTVEGDFAYVGAGHASTNFLVMDVGDPEAPTLAGSCSVLGDASRSVVAGDYVYLAAKEGGLRVIDVSNPAGPFEAASLGTITAMSVEAAGDYLYVAGASAGMHVVDVTDPATPSLVITLGTGGFTQCVVADGDYAYAAVRAQGVTIADIADPTAPTVVTTIDTPGEAYAVRVAGDHAYVSDAAAGVQVLDISDPSSPSIVGSFSVPGVWAHDLAVAGDFAYLADWSLDGGGVHVLDIRVPESPSLLATVDTPGRAESVTTAGDYAYVADHDGGVQVIRIAESYEPSIVGEVDTPDWALRLVAAGDCVYVADSETGLQVIDVCDPTAPLLAGSADTPGYARDVVVSGDYAYVTDHHQGFAVVDISQPTSPTIAGSVSTPGNVAGVAVAGDYAYLTSQGGSFTGLHVADISDPASPSLVDSLTLSDAYGVAIAGDYAYVTGYPSGLQVVDITDPLNPLVAGGASLPYCARNLAIAGDYAFVACGEAGLRVVEIDMPTSPLEVGGVDTPGYARSVTTAGDYAFVADEGSGIQVIDISDPTSPALIGSITTYEAIGVTVAGDHLFVGDRDAGLKVIEVFERSFDTGRNVGQSVDVGGFDELVARARLTSTQVGTVNWQLSADGGAHWESVSHAGDWHDFTEVGNDLRWRSEHVYKAGGVNPTCSQLDIEWDLTPNIICQPRPLELTASDPSGEVDVRFLGGGSGEIYGYSLKFSWDGSVAHTSTAVDSVIEGALLSSVGTSFFRASRSGDHEITVDCALLGDVPGTSDPGTMFTIRFSGVDFGTCSIDLTLLEARDRYNQQLSGFVEEDGTVDVDIEPPSVTGVVIENLTLAHTDDFVKDADSVRLTAVVIDDDPGFGILNVTADLTGFGGASTVGPDTYMGNVATWESMLGDVVAAPSNGTVMATVTATDPMGNVSAEGDSIHADNRKPTPVTEFDASPGHEQCELSWTSGTDTYLDGVTVRRFGNAEYPLYPLFVGAWPSVDAYYPGDGGAGIEVYNGTGTGAVDAVVERDIYYYQAFSYDIARNFGDPAPTARDLATNYWLGDVADVENNWVPDGHVHDADIAKLSGTYMVSSPAAPFDQCDVGPTVHPDGNRLGLPHPDGEVQFEDLMIFAMNYDVVSPRTAPMLGGPADGPLCLELRGGSSESGDGLSVALRLEGNTDEVKGLSAAIVYDPTLLEFAGARLAEGMLSSPDRVFFWHGASEGRVAVDIAVLGTGLTLGGSGEVAVLTFRELGQGCGVALEDVTLRDAENNPLDAGTSDLDPELRTPTAFRICRNVPNPFGPATSVRYDVPSASDVTIRVYDVAGRVVCTLVDGPVQAGSRVVRWDGRNERGEAVSSGVYFCVMEAGEYRGVRKVTLLR